MSGSPLRPEFRADHLPWSAFGLTPSVACGDTSPNVASLLGEETEETGDVFLPPAGGVPAESGEETVK